MTIEVERTIVSVIVYRSRRATIIIHNNAVLLDGETVTTNPINFDGPILKLRNYNDPNPPPITAAGERQGTKKIHHDNTSSGVAAAPAAVAAAQWMLIGRMGWWRGMAWRWRKWTNKDCRNGGGRRLRLRLRRSAWRLQ